MKKIIRKCLTGLRAAPAKAAKETKAESSAVANAKARRKKKTRFRLTTTKYRNQKLRPAFDAFEVKEETPYGTQTTVISPEDGIHSLNWAILTPPQPNAGFLKLPVEIRNRIYALVLLHPNHPIGNTYVHPRKKLKKYINEEHAVTSPPTITTYNILTHVCRQFYIDIVGSGLLYRWATWDFSSPDHMRRYLSTINPAHKNAIRNIHVKFHSTQSAKSPPLAFFKMLASIKNLTRLRLTITIHKDLLAWDSNQQMAVPPPRSLVFLKPQTIQKLKTEKWAILNDTQLQHFELKLLPQAAWGRPWYYFNPSLIRNGDYGVGVLEKEILGLVRGEEGEDMAVEDPDYQLPRRPEPPAGEDDDL